MEAAGIELRSLLRLSKLQILRSQRSQVSDQSRGRGTCEERGLVTIT